jgi:hypothetical protein
MARIHSLRDTEDKELRNEYLLANAKVKDWFYFSTGCLNQYSLQPATFLTDLLLDYPVVAFHCEDDDGTIRIERYRLEDRGEFYEVR